MSITTERPSRAATRTGLAITALVSLFLAFDSISKLMQPQMLVEATVQMGFPASSVLVIGTSLLVCLALYLVPRTAVLGAVLLTGYLGGAVCAHLRIESPLFSHVLFPVYVGVLVWLGLYLRDERVRQMIAPRR